MTFTVSWWLLALVVGATAPFWIRALVNRWEQRAQRRSERIVAQFRESSARAQEGDPQQPDG